MIKAVVMDMDGTLLNEEETINPEVRDKLLQLEEKGIRLILASGRSYTRLMPYADLLHLKDHAGWLLEVDGIALYDLKNMERKVLDKLKPEDIQNVYDDLYNLHTEPQAVFDDGLFYAYDSTIEPKKKKEKADRNLPDDYPDTAGPWSWLNDSRGGYPKIKRIYKGSEISRDVNKIQVMMDENQTDDVYAFLKDKYGDKFEIFRTTPRQIEILPKGISKGLTLERLMKANDWKSDEVLAFGDGENDVSLFDVVKYSFAMENAKDYVKDKAWGIAGDHRDKGILVGFEKMGI